MQYFLLKTEPSTYSIDTLHSDRVTSWGGVRNYQARNILRDDVEVGDLVVVYHSSCEVPAVVGTGTVVRSGYPDPTQFDKKSHYYDSGSTKEHPRWFCVDIAFKEKYKNPISLPAMRLESSLGDMRLLARGNRLSVFPIAQRHFETILRLSR
jgi:predicted RNA-binding protein with PUA-like domain